MIIINADKLSDGLYNVKDGQIFKYKAKGGTARTYEMGEIVRCKECRHAYYADNRVPHEKTWVCERFMNEEITSNDFCSWGERKGGDPE